jgi:AcrR family transcriptional regulator
VCRWLALAGTVDEDCRILASLHANRGGHWRLVYALERLQRSVQRGLTYTAARWPLIQTAYTLVFRAVHILNKDEQVSAAEVRRRYAEVLAEMQAASADPGTDPLVQAWYTTFLKVTANYGEALFWCYDHPDLPHTNNDLEHLFGSLRYHERRASGRKQVAPMLLLRGQARVLASVSTRLH